MRVGTKLRVSAVSRTTDSGVGRQQIRRLRVSAVTRRFVESEAAYIRQEIREAVECQQSRGGYWKEECMSGNLCTGGLKRSAMDEYLPDRLVPLHI